VSLIQRDHLVEQIPTAVADPALGDTILSGTAELVRFACMPRFFGCSLPEFHPAEKLNRSPDVLTVKTRLDRPYFVVAGKP
jgi:hypothetical protein